MTDNPSSRWARFLEEFYRPPNQLSLDAGVAELDVVIQAAQAAIHRQPADSIVIPARLDGATYYFGVAFDKDQSRNLRDLLRAHIGSSWTDFTGRPLSIAEAEGPLDSAAVGLAGGDPDLVYRFHVAPAARNSVRKALSALVQAIAARPHRRARMAVPIGRLIGDFEDACAAREEHRAQLTYQRLAADHRISATNRLYLHLQLLTSFERWTDVESMPAFGQLLGLSRPALPSDALARYAMSTMAPTPAEEEFRQAATRFGALITSVSAIRSVCGARYYTYWNLTAGTSRDTLLERVSAAGWDTDPVISRLLKAPSPPHTSAVAGGDREQVRGEIGKLLRDGQYDDAIDLLLTLDPTEADLPAVVLAVRQTLTPAAVDLIEHHRRVHGAAVVAAAMAATGWTPEELAASGRSIEDDLVALFDPDLSAPEREVIRARIQRGGLAQLFTPGGTGRVVTTLQNIASGDDRLYLEAGLEICIDLLRDIKLSGSSSVEIRPFAMCLLELWAIHDRSGERRLLHRVIQLVSDLLEAGTTPAGFDEIVEFLRTGWSSFLTDADLHIGLDVIELLAWHMPDGAADIHPFAQPILSRLGMHNFHRLPPAALAVAAELAPGFGLQIEMPPEASTALVGAEQPASGTSVVFYTLMEQAAERAITILKRRYPTLELIAMSDHVATSRLKSVTRSADIVIIVDRAAKHAATDAIKEARTGRPIRYASGRGTTSLVETAEEAISELVRGDGDSQR